LLHEGETLADSNPDSANIPFKFVSGLIELEDDNYEVTVTAAGAKTVLAGPVPLNLAVGDVVELVILDTADPNTAQILIYSNVL
jgi:hypothetical protein